MKIIDCKCVCDECTKFKKGKMIQTKYTSLVLCNSCYCKMTKEVYKEIEQFKEEYEDIPLSSGNCEVITLQELSELKPMSNSNDEENTEFDYIFDLND
jgi:hypothetical protein